MGEKNAKRECILGGFVKNEVGSVEDTCLLIKDDFAFLHSFSADKLKYVQGKACGYNKCKLGIAHEAELIVESNGERKI